MLIKNLSGVQAWDGSYNGNPTSITFPQAGKVVMFTRALGRGSKVILSGGGKTQTIYPAGGLKKTVTNITVTAGQTVSADLYDNAGQKALGWIAPAGNICGSGAPLPPTDGVSPGSYAKIDISDLVSLAQSGGQPLVSTQCWADSPEWSGDKDFNDFFMVYGVEGTNPSPTPSISPSPSPTSQKAQWVVRKFRDGNKNGVWDSDEAPTGEKFQFDWKENEGSWFRIETSGETGRSETKEVSVGTRIEIKELTKDGWSSTTGMSKSMSLTEPKTYYFDFGNVESTNFIPTPAPSIIPETGICLKC